MNLGVIIMNRKPLFFILFLIFLGFVFYLNAKVNFNERSALQPSPEQNDQISEVLSEEEETDDETLSDVLSKEDPVKEFITEKAKAAIRAIFNKKLNIVAIGDSLTAGSGDETNNGGYVGILDDHLNDQIDANLTFTNLGKRGNRTDQLLQRLEEQDIINEIEEADIILITIGANDVMKVFQNNITRLTTDAFEEELPSFAVRLQAITDRLTTINDDANIYFIGFYNPYFHYFPEVEELDHIITTWNERIETMTKQYDHETFIPVKDVVDDASFHFLAEDNFHPNYKGYELIANEVAQYLIEKEGE